MCSRGASSGISQPKTSVSSWKAAARPPPSRSTASNPAARATAAATAIAGVAATLAFLILRPSPQQQALSWSTLRSATYPSEFTRSKQALLRDGVYEEEIAPGSATRLRILLADIVGFGNIDDDDS